MSYAKPYVVDEGAQPQGQEMSTLGGGHAVLSVNGEGGSDDAGAYNAGQKLVAPAANIYVYPAAPMSSATAPPSSNGLYPPVYPPSYPPAYLAPVSETQLPQYVPQTAPLRGDEFLARARGQRYHVHVEKWLSDSWKVYTRHCGAFCLALAFTTIVTFLFFVIFAVTINSISNDHGNGGDNSNTGAQTTASLLAAINSIRPVAGLAHPHPAAAAAVSVTSLFYATFEDVVQSRRRQDIGVVSNTDNETVPETVPDTDDNDNDDDDEKDKHHHSHHFKGMKSGEQHEGGNGGAVAFALISLFLFYFLFVMPMHEGFTLAAFQALQGHAVNFSHFFIGYNYLSSIAIKGTILLASRLVPVIGVFLQIYCGLALMFFIPLLMNHPELTRNQALKLSFNVISRNLCQWLLFLLVIIVINIIGFFAFGLGLIVTVPISAIVVAVAYADVFGLEGAVPL